MRKAPHLLFHAMLACGLWIAAGESLADRGDCGQPTSSGPTPNLADALTILKGAVGQVTFCDIVPRICDLNADGRLSASDAILALRCAVGFACILDCGGDPGSPACSSAEITVVSSDFDQGWTGIAHDSELMPGSRFSVRVKRTCSITSSMECGHDDDCPGSETCQPTCNCNDDVTCAVTGPTHDRHCQNDLAPCNTNADCDPEVPCVHLFGPPQPLSSGGTPLCLVNAFAGPVSGGFHSATGEVRFSTSLRARVFLGIAIDKPCPRCGDPAQDPRIGETFNCSGGPRNGEVCTADAVSDEFGGTSFDCPPWLDAGISGAGLPIRLGEITTGTTTRTAQLPCKYFGFTGNPTVPGSNPKCIDKTSSGDPVCASNADCMRCSGDITTACTNNGDCTGKDFCAEAPDQPVTCGFWCSCGFCNGNTNLPCLQHGDCPHGETCDTGSGGSNQPGAPQQRPNDCSSDKFVCGGEADEQCGTTRKSSCSGAPFRTCETNADCETYEAGFCSFEPRPCFGSRITRTGAPSPLGNYCALEDRVCGSNADCSGMDDFCAADTARPEVAVLFCMPATAQSGVNSASGITGPAALRLSTFLQVCRCGDGVIGCDESCDDGGIAAGDGCDDFCRVEWPVP